MNTLVFPAHSSMKSNKDCILAEEAPSRTKGTINPLVSVKRRYLTTNITVP